MFVGLDFKNYVTIRLGVKAFVPICQYGSHLPRWRQCLTTTLYN